jgi:hypothetical protein
MNRDCFTREQTDAANDRREDFDRAGGREHLHRRGCRCGFGGRRARPDNNIYLMDNFICLPILLIVSARGGD